MELVLLKMLILPIRCSSKETSLKMSSSSPQSSLCSGFFPLSTLDFWTCWISVAYFTQSAAWGWASSQFPVSSDPPFFIIPLFLLLRLTEELDPYRICWFGTQDPYFLSFVTLRRQAAVSSSQFAKSLASSAPAQT